MPGSTITPSSLTLPPGSRAINTPECYLKDAAFLRTLALCYETYCVKQDGVALWQVERYWAGHLGTGSLVGNWSENAKPVMSFAEALRYAKMDVEATAGSTPIVVVGEPLNVTSLVREEVVLPIYGSLVWFEQVQRSKTFNTVSFAITSVFLPILTSLLRFLPGRPPWYSQLVVSFEKPLIGHRHRAPIGPNLGYMPTRGQFLYLLYLLTTQIFLCIFPLPSTVNTTGNTIAPSREREILFIIGKRSGMFAMANFVALFLFSARNNILLWITNWSHGTFILLHGWVGYCTIFQVSVHSITMLIPILRYGNHAVESKLPYWVWGIIGTLALVLLLPTSSLPMRKKAYEFFLVFHQAFAALALIGTFFHVYLLYGYSWGIELWLYVGGILWFGDRALRLMRVVSNGWDLKAVITPLPGSGDGGEVPYFRVDIDGIVADGHVYVYFPTLSWRFWESHPFSVISTFKTGRQVHKRVNTSDSDEAMGKGNTTPVVSPESQDSTSHPCASLIVRVHAGTTKALARRLLASQDSRITLPVFVESSYYSNPAAKRDLARCSTLLCFAGGVGIAAVIPLIRTFGGLQATICWGVREPTLVRALEKEFILPLKEDRSRKVHIRMSVGSRMDVKAILRAELMGSGAREDGEENIQSVARMDEGDLGVVVCGPPGMADDVRWAVAEYARRSRRGIVFVDEAFAW